MDLAPVLYIVLLLVYNHLISLDGATTNGYIPLFRKNCLGGDLQTNINVYTLDECRAACDVHTQCQAFMFSFPFGFMLHSRHCKLKTACRVVEDRRYFWLLYEKISQRVSDCSMHSIKGFALYGHNDVVVESSGIDICKKKCLVDSKCLSFDYKSKGQVCFLSYDSKDTKPSFFYEHYAMTYYHKTCGPDAEEVPTEVIMIQGGSIITTKDGHCMRTYEVGSMGTLLNTKYNDEEMMFFNITGIGVSYSNYINSIKIWYGTVVKSHGRPGNRMLITRLHPDEYITGVEGNANNRITKLLLITNQRSIGPLGSSEGREFSADGHGKPLLYFSGTYDDASIVGLNCHFKC